MRQNQIGRVVVEVQNFDLSKSRLLAHVVGPLLAQAEVAFSPRWLRSTLRIWCARQR
jgi:hypothetical protein